MKRFLSLSFAIFLSLTFGVAHAQPSYVGADKCGKCHKASFDVWKGTKHHSSFKKIHKNKIAKKIVKSIGEKRMKKSETCATCHYTVVQKGKKLKPISGPSCESCHGRASKWIAIHNDYGGPGAKRTTETPEHKAKRKKAAAAAGMIWPSMIFDVASNCMSCHGLANPKLSGEHASKMLANGHPLNPKFELTKYYNGSVRHRFYPPDVTKNKELTKPQMARLYLVGQAAALVSATAAIAKTDDPKYTAAQKKRISFAKEILSKVPEAAKVLKTPTKDAGRQFADAIKGKDFTGLVGSRLPTKFK